MAVNKKYLSLLITGIILLGVVVASFLSPLQGHLRTGDQAFAAGNYALALKEYQLAEKASPDNWNLQVKIAQTYLKQADYHKAEDVLDTLANRNSRKSKTLNPWLAQVQLGLAKQAEGPGVDALDEVIAYLRRGHDYQPDNQAISSFLAEELFTFSLQTFQGGDSPELNEAIALDPKPIYKVDKVRRYAQDHDQAKMEMAVKALTPADLADPNAQIVLAGTYIDLARRDTQTKHTAMFDQGLAILPQNPALLFAKMQQLCKTNAGKSAQAIAEDPALPANTRQFLENYWQGLTGNSFVQDVKHYNNWEQGGGGVQIVHDQTATWVVSWLQRQGKTEITGLNLQNGQSKLLATIPVNSFNFTFAGIDRIFYSQGSSPLDEILYYLGPDGKSREIYKTQNASNLGLLGLSPDHHYLALVDGRDFVVLHLNENQGQMQAEVTARLPGVQFIGWSPDSGQIMLWLEPSRAQDGKTIIINSQGKVLRTLANADGKIYGGWNPTGKVITGNIRREQLELEDQASGTYTPLFSSFLYQAIMAENGYQLAWPIYLGGRSNYIPNFFPGVPWQDWSPDGSYVALNARLRSSDDQMVWVLKSGTDMPFPINATGMFVGWSGPNKMLFADYSKFSQYGDGRLDLIAKVPIEEITLRD